MGTVPNAGAALELQRVQDQLIVLRLQAEAARDKAPVGSTEAAYHAGRAEALRQLSLAIGFQRRSLTGELFDA